jgi:Lar family restriction alleviation protein
MEITEICPFCGDDETVVIQEDSGFCVLCYNCNAKGSTADTEDYAIIHWNERV